MPKSYEVCGDEAWVHGNLPLNRYWCFFGGLFGETPAIDALETDLRASASSNQFLSEFKWSSISPASLAAYIGLVDVLFEHIRTRGIKFRQVFLDRALVHYPSPGDPVLTDLDIQFRICYQFIKHSFGLQYLPQAVGGNHKITIRMDTHSSQKHKKRLKGEIESIPQKIGRNDLDIEIAHICSTKLLRIQACDIVLGAAGSYGNKAHKQRHNGKKRMTDSQKVRFKLAKHIYNQLRDIDSESRGSKAFNWFESTGHDGNKANRYFHKVRIWKFMPRKFQIDKGWRNSSLTKQGLYVKQELDPQIKLASG